MLVDTIKMNFDKIDDLRHGLDDSHYAEYVFHKLFDNADYTWTQSLKDPKSWTYPDCWLARYYLYYVLHNYCFDNTAVLDLGSNLNFYSIWAVINGAKSSMCVEPDTTRHNLGKELVDIRQLNNKIDCKNMSLNDFCASYRGEKYDTVLLLDVFYYLSNGIDILNFIKNHVKPQYLLFESTVVEDYSDNGHYELWHPSTDTAKFQSYSNAVHPVEHNLALRPSRNALNKTITSLGWKIINYYTYSDFVGYGESPPRKAGCKNFYVLTL